MYRSHVCSKLICNLCLLSVGPPILCTSRNGVISIGAHMVVSGVIGAGTLIRSTSFAAVTKILTSSGTSKAGTRNQPGGRASRLAGLIKLIIRDRAKLMLLEPPGLVKMIIMMLHHQPPAILKLVQPQQRLRRLPGLIKMIIRDQAKLMLLERGPMADP